jgi:hypothetical protein
MAKQDDIPDFIKKDIDRASGAGEAFFGPFQSPKEAPLPEGSSLVDPEFGQGIKQVGIGAAEGAASIGLPLAGMVAGTKAGIIAGTPLGLPGVVGLGLLGMGTGFFAGRQGASAIKDLLPPTPTDPELVPYREGGKTFGESILLQKRLPQVRPGRDSWAKSQEAFYSLDEWRCLPRETQRNLLERLRRAFLRILGKGVLPTKFILFSKNQARTSLL